MLYSSNGGGMSGQKNDAAGSVGFFRQSLCDLFFPLVVDIEMGEFDFFPAKRLLITRRVEAVAFFVIKADTNMLVSITAYTIAFFS